MNDQQDTLDRFASKLECLRRVYLNDPKQFLWTAGDFAPGPSLSNDDIKQIEADNGVLLPEEYRAFLERFGNVATGPGNHYFRVREGIKPNSGKPFPLTHPFLGVLSPDHQRLPQERQREDYAVLSRTWDSIPKNQGVVAICDYGCAIYGFLVVNGAFEGRIWVLQGDNAYYGPFGGCEPLHDELVADWEPTSFPREYSFFEWYEHWLDAQLKSVG